MEREKGEEQKRTIPLSLSLSMYMAKRAPRRFPTWGISCVYFAVQENGCELVALVGYSFGAVRKICVRKLNKEQSEGR